MNGFKHAMHLAWLPTTTRTWDQ